MLSCLLSLLLPTDWIVDAANGPGTNFLDLPLAIAAAANGDTIFVRAGSYTGFHLIGKALTVRGAGMNATIVGDPGPGQSSIVGPTPAGSVVVLSNVTLHGANAGLTIDGGHLLLLNCRLEGAAGYSGLQMASGEVEAFWSQFAGGVSAGGSSTFPVALGGDGATMYGGALAAYYCSFFGGGSTVASPYPAYGGAGLSVFDGHARLDLNTLAGGDGLTGGGDGLDCLGTGFVRVNGNSVNCQILGGHGPGGTRAFGIDANVAGPGVEARGIFTLLGGAAGAVQLGLPQLPGLFVDGATILSGEVDPTQPVSVTLQGVLPGAPYFLAIGTRPLFQSPVPPVVGELLLDANALAVFPGLLDAAGGFQFSFLPVAVFGGGLSFPVYAQAAVFDVATGELRLSNLDAHIYSL